MAKKEYIEREKVLALQTDLHFDNIEQLKYWKCRHIDPIEVRLLPAADVRTVVRGEWLGMDCSYWRHAVWGAYPVNRIRYKCSVCGRIENRKEPFCNCGADMRGNDSEEE